MPPEEEKMQLAKAQRTKNLLLYLYCFLTTSLVGGTIYGYPALRRQLIHLGSTIPEKKLGAAYTAGAWSVQGAGLVFGILRDRFGTRLIAQVSFLCVICGAFGIAFQSVSNEIFLGVNLFLLGLGSGAQLCVQPVAQLFPKNSALFMSGLSGAFQVSGVVYAVLVGIAKKTSEEGELTVAYGGVFAGAVGLMLALAFWTLPKSASFIHEKDLKAAESAENVVDPIDGTFTVHLSGKEQMWTKEYVGLVLWFTVLVTPFQYYVGSIGWHLERLGDDDGTMTNAFAMVYGLAAFLAPVGGMVADTFGLGVTMAFASIAVGSSFFVLELGGASIALEVHSVGLVLYAVGRLIVFAMFFSSIGKMFGYKYYGLLVGWGMFVSAVFSTLQYPLIAIALDGDYAISNYACGVGCLSAVSYCAAMYRWEKEGSTAFDRLKHKKVLV